MSDFVDIIHNAGVSNTGLCLRHQVNKLTQLVSINLNSPYQRYDFFNVNHLHSFI